MKIKRKFFIKNVFKFIIPLLIPLVILGSFAFFLTQRLVRNDIDNNNIRMLNQTKETVELMFNELDSLSINFKLNPSVIIQVKEQLNLKENDYESFKSFESIMNLINPPVNSKPFVQSLYIYYENNKKNLLVSNLGLENLGSFVDNTWYQSFIANNTGSDTWIESRDVKQFLFEKSGTHVITLYNNLYQPGSTKADGVIVMNIKKDYIDTLLNNLVSYPDQYIVIIDEKNGVISESSSNPSISKDDIKNIHLNPSAFFEFSSDKGQYIVSQTNSDRYRLNYISIIPKRTLYKKPIQLLYVTALFVIFSFILGLIITYYISKKNYEHLNRIISAFESAEKGEPPPELPSRVKDEYGFILQNIIKTFIEQSYLKVQLSEKKYQLKAAEMTALQSQINPHFLFNTLKTLFWKTIELTEGQNEASKIIEYLSNILHYSLESSDTMVTLTEEIQNTQSYIEIQKIRYKDKFGVIWQYDDSITMHKVIKLLFQPFIENSIYHGIKEKAGSSYIKIKIAVVRNLIKIVIIDNGLGITKGNLDKINSLLFEDGDHSEHIGLYNTNKRLKLAYGDKYGIKIRSRYGLGTVIYIDIPTA